MSPRLEAYGVPTRIYAFRRGVPSACHHYRVTTPLEALKQAGFDLLLDDPTQPNWDKITPDLINYSGIHLYYLLTGRDLLQRAYTYQRLRNDPLGLKTPKIVFDADDNAPHCSIFNPKFVTLGTRTPTGERLRPGSQVDVEFEDGTELTVWKDGEVYGGEKFNVQANLDRLNLVLLMARAADLVTTTTAALAEEFLAWGCKNVFVYPNSLQRADYPKIKPARPRHPVIFWQGGQSHWEDWIHLREPLREVCARRPKVRFVIWGQEFDGVHGVIPRNRYEFIEWVPYPRYTYRLATIGHHINLCPLMDNRFNRAKSAIKWYESSAIHKPAATIAANVGPYGEIVDGKTGMLYNTPEEFVTKLIDMIDDLGECDRMARRAHEWVWANRDAEVTVWSLAIAYAELMHG